MWSPERREALKRARIKRGVYKCEECGGIEKKLDVDHVEPVGRTPGSRGAETTWQGFVERLFVPPDKLRAICKKCHQSKTYS